MTECKDEAIVTIKYMLRDNTKHEQIRRLVDEVEEILAGSCVRPAICQGTVIDWE